jgi:acyl-[acyl-carrier-protein]-phospholipid O-acyltransferase/long-chain-fatty-acid--[acyl-carrier-protein] ligase
VGELPAASGATFLLSTPTFARTYVRRVPAEQFKTLRFAFAGAERCPPELKQAFKERFGADLLEGYGCTELAPVVAVNLPSVERDGVREIRSRDGSVGRPLPGIHVLTIDPETRAILPTGAEGLLVVRSPARMKGYLGRDDLTAAAFVHGGYNTGDVGRIDEEGFITITGRLARFAKIGGEMVPLDNVEAALQTAIGDAAEIAVAAVADPSKGERLVVLHTTVTIEVEVVLRALDAHPPLWRPKPKDFLPVDAIPKLGTGKRDLAAVKRLANEKTAPAPAKPEAAGA